MTVGTSPPKNRSQSAIHDLHHQRQRHDGIRVPPAVALALHEPVNAHANNFLKA